MGEGSKQVRVDNWGIFFLQRLQMFFNKTDYCDLTLQFEGNVQLKVHRLVMNACTEYFQVLEQTCEMVDDVLIMPSDLQADVVLPIVNFMYTGMLEFHTSIFDKLYKTANLMNITVLTKLLDAQKTPSAFPKSRKNLQMSTNTWNLHGKKVSPKASDELPVTLPGRKLPVWKRKSVPSAVPHTVVPHYYPEQKKVLQLDPLACYDNAPKPTRFEWPEEELSTLNLFDSTFDDISYTSKPLLTQDDEPRPSTSFDRIKETPDINRRPTSYSSSTVDMEDVKDYVKEQKIRSNMVEEEDDDDEAVDNDFECKIEPGQKRKISFETSPAKKVRFSTNEKENQMKSTKINITPTGKVSSDVDHTKIISEVLKKFPNMVKKNKNIRLKILAKSNNTPTTVEQIKKPILTKVKAQIQPSSSSVSSNISKSPSEEKNSEDGPWKCQRCSTDGDPIEFVLYYLYRKHMTDVHNKKFDSRMCKFCGHRSTKHNMLMYHQYTKHGVKPPPAYKFPKCNRCPYIALTENLLMKHKMNHTKYELQCVECKVTFNNRAALTSHVQITGHTGKSDRPNFDCQYCIKKFLSSSALFSHIRMQHRDEGRRDGIVSIDEVEADEEDDVSDSEEPNASEQEYVTSNLPTDEKDKVRILSDVKLPSIDVQQGATSSLDQQNVALEPSSEAEALSNVASGIATSLGLVDVVVLDENQQYILHTDNQQEMTGSESQFILPDLQDTQTFGTTQQVITSEQNVITQSMLQNSDIGSTDELVMVLTDHDYGDGNNEIINNDSSNIVVLYSHPIEGQDNQFITSQGNLMLTSQAGLLELRNGNAVVTSAASHFITSSVEATDSTHIESIEMIQREIDQHPNQLHLVQDVKPTLVQQVVTDSINLPMQEAPQHMTVPVSVAESEPQRAVSPAVSESMTVQFNIFDNLVAAQPNSDNQEVEEASEREKNGDQEEAIPEGGLKEQPVENKNDLPVILQQDLDTSVQKSTEATNTENLDALPPPCIPVECSGQMLEAGENSLIASNATATELIEGNVQEQHLAPEENNPDDANQPTELVDEAAGNTSEEINEANISTQTNESIQDGHTEEETNKLDMTNESLQETIVENDMNFQPAHSNLHEVAELPKLQEKELPLMLLNESETSQTPNQDVAETSQNQVVANPDMCIPEPPQRSENSPVCDEHSNLSVDNCQPENNHPNLHDEASHLQDEISPSGDEDFHMLDESSHSQVEPEKEQDDSSHVQEDSHENSQFQDESSQAFPELPPIKSARSQSDSNQSAKIILDDWEDTDSQQSDSKNLTNVHKLIDDWDEDEEESKKS